MIIIGLLMASCLVGAFSFTPSVLALTHGPIKIDGNHQFMAPNGVVSGAGTEENPFIIQNWVIDASTANGIEIRNTNMYFIIRNCTISGSASYNGISLYNVDNGKIENNTITGNVRGIALDQSSGNTISRNTISGNSQYSIHIWYSPNNTATGNTVHGNGICGIAVDFSSNTNIINNTIFDNEQYGVNIDSSVGNVFTGNNITGNEVGMFLGFDTSNTLTNNTVSDSERGISIFASANIITGGSVFGNDYGIYLESAPYNVFRYCDIHGNSIYGVYYKPSDNPSHIADAANCWWGSPRGPGGEGPGLGDDVSSQVNYSPWLTAPWGQILEYYVIIESSYGGTTNPTSGGWYASGDAVPIAATPSTNYAFASWTATGGVTITNATAPTTTFKATANGTLRANFVPTIPTFTVLFQSTPAPGGTTSPSGSNSFPQGTSTNITATSSPGYRFIGWMVVGNITTSDLSSAHTTITVHGNATVTAHFEEVVQYSVVISHSTGGTIAPSGSAYYNENATVDLIATAYPGFQFVNWTVTGDIVLADPAAASTVMTVSGTGTAYAYFRALEFNPPVISDLTPSSGSSVAGGNVSIAASFSDDTAIDTSSVSLKIDGSPVTSGLQVTQAGVAYSTALQPGAHTVELTVSDTQGNPRTVSWSFTMASPGSSIPLEYVAIGLVAALAAGVALFLLRKKRL